MIMFGFLLQFMQLTRQNQTLYLNLNNFTKYFFAFDKLNYTCSTPYYIVTMMELKTNYVEI